MSNGLIHSEECRVGTSHRVPQDCKGADYRSIWYSPSNFDDKTVIIGPIEPESNSEEGRKALEAAFQADQDIKDALDAHLEKSIAAGAVIDGPPATLAFRPDLDDPMYRVFG